MKTRNWMLASWLGMLMLIGNLALAQGNGKGHGKGNNKHGDADDQATYCYQHHDQDPKNLSAGRLHRLLIV